MSYVFFICWFAAPIVIIYDPRTFGDLWGRMTTTEHSIAYVMALFCLGAAAGAVRAWSVREIARNESRRFAPTVAGALRDGKIDEAIKICDRYGRSHLSRLVKVGLIPVANRVEAAGIASSNRAMSNARGEVLGELRRLRRFLAILRLLVLGVGGVAVIYLGTAGSNTAIDRVAFLFAGTLYAAGPAFVAEKFTVGVIEFFKVELQNIQSELIEYLIKRSGTPTTA